MGSIESFGIQSKESDSVVPYFMLFYIFWMVHSIEFQSKIE